MNILVITPDLPFPSYKNGRTTTLFSLVSEWSKSNSVCMVVNEVCCNDGINFFEEKGVRVLEGRRSKRNLFSTLDGRRRLSPRNLWSYGGKLPSNLNDLQYDLIVIVGFESLPYFDELKTMQKKGVIVFFELDCLSLLYKRYFESSRNVFKRLYYYSQYKLVEKFELVAYSIFDKVLFVSSVDMKYCKANFIDIDNNKFDNINNGVISTTHAWKSVRSGKALNVCFSGNFDYYPNKIAARFILEKMIPAALDAGREIVFHLVGANPTEEMKMLGQKAGSSVVVTGFVDDIDGYISGMDLYISPLFVGTGMKNKILQGMNLGVPIICTNISIDGIDEMVSGKTCLVCNSEYGAEWVNLAIMLADDREKCKIYSERTKKIISESYEWPSIAKSFLQKSMP